MNNPKRNTKMREKTRRREERAAAATGRAGEEGNGKKKKKRVKTEYDRLRGSAVGWAGVGRECEALCRLDESLTTVAAADRRCSTTLRAHGRGHHRALRLNITYTHR